MITTSEVMAWIKASRSTSELQAVIAACERRLSEYWQVQCSACGGPSNRKYLRGHEGKCKACFIKSMGITS